MDYNKTYPGFADYLPSNLVALSNSAHNQLIKKFNRLVAEGRLPEEGFTSFEIDFMLKQFSVMDSNNISKKIGVGEREGRVYSEIVSQRYYGLSHGIGRSGELLCVQPKAAGSSVLHKLTHKLTINAMETIGVGCIGDALLLPFATGMALTLCFLTLKNRKPAAKYVVLLRIDQKTCIKCIYTAGLIPIVIENTTNKPEDGVEGVISPLETDIAHLKKTLESYDQSEILCVMSVTSCFAPREPDDVIAIGQIARAHGLFHVANNAYGLQCQKTIDMLNKANNANLLDAVVQSTDKNFMVPVGGSLIYSSDSQLTKEISENYPGRASANCVIDMFITLVKMGRRGLLELLRTRKRNFELLKNELGLLAVELDEKVVQNSRNKISIAFTIGNIKSKAKDFGAWLFNCGVMGARVVTRDDKPKSIGDTKLKNFGGHTDSNYEGFPYITIAAAIGGTEEEIKDFIKVFRKTYKDMLKRLEKDKKSNP